MHPPAPAPKTPWRDRLRALRNIPPLAAMVWETSPALASASLGLRLVASFQPVAMLWVAKLIIDEVVKAVVARSAAPDELWMLVGLEVALAVGGDLLLRTVNLCESLLGDRFANHVSLRLMRHAGKLDLAHFEDPVFYDKLERARKQTTSRLSMLTQLAGLAQSGITLLSVSLAVAAFSGWFLVLLAAALLPVFWGETRFAMLAYSLLYRWTPERRELDYLRMLGASLNTAKEVKIFGIGDFLLDRSQKLFERFYAENRGLAIRKAITGSLLNLLPTCGYYAAYAYILYRTINGNLSVGDLTFLAGAFVRSRASMESVFAGLSHVSEQALYIQDLFDFFATESRLENRPNPIPAPRPIRDGFEFRGVSFAYPGRPRPVLNDVSFRLEKGQKIALIGENGAGKTTIVKLLARLYDPTGGEILLDGVDLREYSAPDLRREIGVIFQDYVRFDMVARENIGLGLVDRLDDEARIRQAAGKSLADAVIETLPNGYDQMLGRRFSGGSDLSAGQWQKIALGRAYMRDAQLVILDEPTASLDARAEFEVFERFAELTRGKMAVLISHRFSTVRMADRILVLENGRIVEQGAHGELVRLGGRYADLFALQASGYR
jgi:ATP-binding cassette subfamily B protein